MFAASCLPDLAQLFQQFSGLFGGRHVSDSSNLLSRLARSGQVGFPKSLNDE